MSDTEQKDEAQLKLARLCELYGLVEGGVYRHWKGGLYVIKALSIHEATYEPLVTYRSNREGTNSTRVLANFVETVDCSAGSTIRGLGPRFQREAQ